ncbi:MAG: transcriptional repressor LexA [Planctomycetota bacterium]
MLLTGKQLEVLRFIRDYRRQNAIAPTLEEMAKHFGVSKITIHEHLSHLERKGAIFRARARARGIQVLYDPDSPEGRGMLPAEVSLPVLGLIHAGHPLEAVEDREMIPLGDLVPHGPNHYLLRVRGDSMIEDHIQDGDYVIVERRETARNGETVVAILEDNEATLKRFYRETDHVRLQPANPNYPPMICDKVEIRGVVVGVVRCIR